MRERLSNILNIIPIYRKVAAYQILNKNNDHLREYERESTFLLQSIQIDRLMMSEQTIKILMNSHEHSGISSFTLSMNFLTGGVAMYSVAAHF